MSGPFVSLHNHTELGSPLDGMNDTLDLFKRAKEIDHPGVAVTDHGTLTAIYDAWQASKETGVKLIPGVEAYFALDMLSKKSNHMVLLAKNEEGYRNILRLNYESYKNQVSGYMGKKTPRITWEHIEKYNSGVIALTACANGILSKTIMSGDEELAIEYMLRLDSIFKDGFFLELQPHRLKTEDGKVNQCYVNETLLRLSSDYNIPYTITCDAHYRDKDHARYHDFMLAIKDKKSFDDPDRFRYGVQDMYLKTHEEIIDFFGSKIASIGMKNSIKISEACDVPSYIEPKGPMLPKFPIKQESDYNDFLHWRKNNTSQATMGLPEDKGYLRYKCIEGFRSKLKSLPAKEKGAYWERTKKELLVLENKNFSSYMLIVSDYINWAKSRGMPVGPARGSAAGSLVAYLTGITTIDPIKYGLIFERFHNDQKESFPDIDSDFSDPGMVKEYLREKYGEEMVASISNWSTLSPKVIIKDVARSLRLGGDKSTAFKIANHITSIMPDSNTIEEAMSISNEFDAYMKEYPELYEYASKLQGLTRNWSLHAAGIVIGDRPLYETIPLRIDSDTGLIVTQWEKTRCEENGLIKMDLLGLNTLSVIDNTFKLIKDTCDEEIGIEDIPLDDRSTYDMISSGKTVGVFQLESSLTPLCMKIRPGSIDEISDINALGRPSCSHSQRKSYIRRKFNLEPIKLRNEVLKNALSKTYGVSLYEEGMMTIAKDCAGWDYNQADALRKITKLKGKDKDLVLKTEAKFISDSMKHSNLSYSDARYIWENQILPFGLYGFNKSHSISYSHISYYTAWLRNNYPTQFMCALLNSENPNSDKAQEYIFECSNIGIEIVPPAVGNSGGGYVVLEDMKIATGLSAIKGLGDKAIDEIISNKPYGSINMFFAKTSGRVVNKRVIESLAKSGALDSFGRTRRDLYENCTKYRTKINTAIKKERAFDEVDFGEYNEEWTRKELLLAEKESLGRTISGSLHEVFPGFFRKNNSLVTQLSTLDILNKSDKIKIEVIINSKIKEFKIKQGRRAGEKFAKYLVEDVNGDTTELTVWTEHYNRYKNLFRDGIPARLICKVDEYMDKRGVSLVHVESIYGKKND
jgi:DNA polymerase-3 subunit alpha